MTVTLCDICGKPIIYPGDHGRYKFKKAEYKWPSDLVWTKIDCHDKCIEWLMELVKEKNEKIK